MAPRTVRSDELDAVVAFIATQQSRADSLITYVGTEAEGIRAELDGLDPPWTATARVVDGEGGSIIGAVVAEWNEEKGRAWILGPWVAGDTAAWRRHAGSLLDAALAQLPPSIVEHELSGDLANIRLAELASSRGWTATEANHALVADAVTVAAWGPAGSRAADAGLRAPEPADVAAIAPLHDAEFPATYASAQDLLAGYADGSRIVLIAPGEGGTGIAGYAAGEVHDDGEGFIDFVAVDGAARGQGLGRRLTQAITCELLDRSTNGRVCLTVQDHRTPARALYEALGFRPDGSFVAYRDWI